MNERIMSFERKEIEKNFHDLLSKLISDLPKLLSFAQKILILKSRQEDNLALSAMDSLLNQLSQTFYLNSQLKQNISNLHQIVPSFHNVYRRFRYRLVEVIILFRQKIQSTRSILLSMNNMLKSIETAIVMQQENIFEDFLSLLKDSFYSFIQKQKPQKETNNSSPEKTEHKRELSLQKRQQVSSSKQTFRTMRNGETENQKKMKMMVTTLNRHYSSLSCLNLDYNHFRSSYFQGTNNGNTLYTEYYQRNRIAKNQIGAYSKQFKEYLQKKEKKGLDKRLLERKMQRKEQQKRKGGKNILSQNNGQNRFRGGLLKNTNNWVSARQKSLNKNTRRNNLTAEIKQTKFLHSQIQSQPVKVQYHVNQVKMEPNNFYFSENTQQTIKNTFKRFDLIKKKAIKGDSRHYFKTNKDISCTKSKFQ